MARTRQRIRSDRKSPAIPKGAKGKKLVRTRYADLRRGDFVLTHAGWRVVRAAEPLTEHVTAVAFNFESGSHRMDSHMQLTVLR